MKTPSNDNKGPAGQEMDYIANGCRLGMFIEEARYVLELCGVKWWSYR